MINFDRYAVDGNAFLNELSIKLNQEDNKTQVGILLRSVLHVLRDCMTVQQSFHFIAQLPMFLKALYVEQWKYSEEPVRVKTLEEFSMRIEEEQRKLGKKEFNWRESPIDSAKMIITVLHKYVSEGEFSHIVAELPMGIKSLFPEGQKVAG